MEVVLLPILTEKNSLVLVRNDPGLTQNSGCKGCKWKIHQMNISMLKSAGFEDQLDGEGRNDRKRERARERLGGVVWQGIALGFPI